MDDEQLDQAFRKRSVQALLAHVKKLDAMEEAISQAARTGTAIPHLKAIFEEFADASHELESLIEYYQDQQIPGDVAELVQVTLKGINDCSTAFVFYSSAGGFARTALSSAG